MNYDVVVVANGKGTRAALGFNKVFFTMKNSKTVLENACSNFLNDEDCKRVVVVTDEKESVFSHPKLIVVDGGAQRYNSVCNGLKECKSEYVMVHDGARPLLPKEDVEKLKEALKDNDGAMLAKKAIDTIKRVKDGYVVETIDREEIYQALTPQAFKTKMLIDAYNTLDLTNVTDDASVFEMAGHKVKIVEGDPRNIKLTSPNDFENL